MKIIIGVTLWLIFCFAAMAESYVTIEANIGLELAVNEDHWDGDVPFEFRVTYVKPYENNIYFTGGYSHLSNVLSGPPFNTDKESVLDRVFVGFGVKFNL